MKEKLINYLKATYPGLAIRTVEEQRCLDVITDVAKEVGHNVFTWRASQGFRLIHQAKDNEWHYLGTPDEKACIPGTEMLGDAAKSLALALERAAEADQIARSRGGKRPPPAGIFVFTDLHTWAGNLDPVSERFMKEALLAAPVALGCVIFLGPEFRIPISWENSVTCMDFELPTKEALEAILAKSEAGYIASGGKLNKLEGQDRLDAIRAASGLTEPEAANAFALACIEGRSEKKLKGYTVAREKAAAVRRSGLMEMIDPEPKGLDAIGGIDVLKRWIVQRKGCYSEEARKYGLPSPRGLLVAGMPGSGKSLGARCIATAFGCPVVRLDIGRLMAGIVGQSEAQTRAALALAEAAAPCVLFVDEIEKSLAGSRGGGELDSGVGRRVLGTILSWLQDRKRDVFVYATANQVWQLPPELLRKGRFDEIFFFQLPQNPEREEIFRIHLEKRGRDPKKFKLSKIVDASQDFTGSECEEAIISGMYSAFNEGKEIATDHIVEACKATKPLIATMKEDIERLEKWGKERARAASSAEHTLGDKFRRHMA